jgi:hypothetical protein
MAVKQPTVIFSAGLCSHPMRPTKVPDMGMRLRVGRAKSDFRYQLHVSFYQAGEMQRQTILLNPRRLSDLDSQRLQDC